MLPLLRLPRALLWGGLVYWGKLYHQCWLYPQALASFTRALALYPHLYAAFNNRGWTYYQMGRDEDAITEVTRVLALAPITDSL